MTATPTRPGIARSGADDAARWRPGERLHHLFDELVARRPDAIAVDLGEQQLSFAELDRRAWVLARALHDAGVRPGDRVALLLDSPATAYAAMLATSRVHAAYVPLDAGFPDDRIAYICEDAAVSAVVVTAGLRDRAPAGPATIVAGHTAAHEPLTAADAGEPVDELAYLIYTSGTTGRPKGVEIEHAAIVNFVRVAAECYGYREGDRVYQGMTLAFDFSVEELWVPWCSGATLVPKPAGGALVGEDLQDFLRERRITALCCVPTLLATLDETALPGLRFLLVSGEACPQDLVTRWHRDDRRFLNVYGPTEATVTATWTPVHPQRRVTLGRPLPTYTCVVLDTDTAGGARLVEPGELGELGIAGIGLARGYLDRPDLTAAAFVDDPFDLPDNPSGRIYRTGDLARIGDDGEIEYHGRIDTQVKIRGYRIELTEIESVLLGVTGVAQACVDTWEPAAGLTELVAYYSVRPGAAVTADALHAALAERVPPYMVPAYFEQLDRIPLTTSDKADRKALPAPTTTRRVALTGETVAPADDTERTLAATLASTLGVPDVSVTADFFAELGATSLLMARYSSALREHGLRVTIRDIYAAPTVRGIATGLTSSGADPAAPVAEPVRPPHRARRGAMTLTGLAQLALFAGYAWLVAAILEVGYDAVGGTGVAAAVGRAAALAVLGVLALAITPVLAKWLLVGRWREQEFGVWGLRYLRFWVVKTLVRTSIFVLFAGSPLYSVYLRALGAKVGRRTVVLSRHVPVATDLISLGDDVVVRKDVWFNGYRAEGGRIRTGRVDVGERGFVGEAAVLDVDTAIESDGQLAHASSLHAGQRVPTGAAWHGSPAEPAGDVDFRRVPTGVRPPRRAVTAVAALAQLAGVAAALMVALLAGGLALGSSYGSGATGFVLEVVVGSALLLAGSLVLGGFAAVLLPRLARRWLRPGVAYPMHGPRNALLRAVVLISNRPLLVTLFGDSWAITGFMRRLGWDLGRVEQTGSNFGTTHRHEWPFLSAVGSGTMISDGLSMANAEYSSTHFRLGEARIGARNFLGNKIVYPAGGRTGDNVLLATKVMVPLHGEPRHDTGLLGSPAFEIPRSTGTDGRDGVPDARLPELLRAKRRHNVGSMIALLAGRWGQLAVLTALGFGAAALHDRLGVAAYALATLLALPATALWFVAIERAALIGHRLSPRECSIYDPWFWRHERLWKLLTPFLAVFDGTPFKPLVLRALGVRVGRRLFDDGASMPEHTLVRIGDDCTLNAGATVQCHSLEDGRFKCDRTELGDGVTVGVAGFVHYGVTLADDSALDADAFLMKGSGTTPGSRWRGNPAVPLS